MKFYTVTPTSVWPEKYPTWYVGSSNRSQSEEVSYSQSTISPSGSGLTYSNREGAAATYFESTANWNEEGTSIYESSINSRSESYEKLYLPSTGRLFDESGNSYIATLNETYSDSDNYTRYAGSSYENGDTRSVLTYSQAWGSTQAITGDVSSTGGATGEAFSVQYTGTFLNTSIFEDTLFHDFLKTTSMETNGTIGWDLPATTTTSYYEISISGTSWTTAMTGVNFESSLTTAYNLESTGFHTVRDTIFSGGTTARTNHVHSPLRDTVIINDDSLFHDSMFLGHEVWVFKSSLSDSSSFGRFEDFYSSRSETVFTIPDYQRFISSQYNISYIDVSHNTTTQLSGTQTQTLTKTSYNGSEYNSTETYVSGSGTFARPALSNTVSGEITFNVGDVSSSVSTISGVGTNPHTFVDVFYQTKQTTFYTGIHWTSDTYTDLFTGPVKKTYSRFLFSSSIADSLEIYSRITTEDNIFISSFNASSGFLGMVPRTTTLCIDVPFQTTTSAWKSFLNEKKSNYESSRSYSESGFSQNTYFTMSENPAQTLISKTKLHLHTWSIPYESFVNPFQQNSSYQNAARYRVLPRGYAGFGGSFNIAALNVYNKASLSKVSGSEFSDTDFGIYSLSTQNLPTVSIYEGVTMFPVRTNYDGYFPYPMLSSKYLNREDDGNPEIGVTWESTTSTTTTGGVSTSIKTRRFATYQGGCEELINGDFYTEIPLILDQGNPRYEALYFDGGGGFGGYGLGANGVTDNQTIHVAGGILDYTVYEGDSSVYSSSVIDTRGFATIEIESNQGVAIKAQPIIFYSWGVTAHDEYFRESLPRFPAEYTY